MDEPTLGTMIDNVVSTAAGTIFNVTNNIIGNRYAVTLGVT